MNIILYEILISLSTGLMYFLTAAGMSIVVSGMNVINFGQGQFYMLGTLICFSLWKLTGSFALSVIAAMLIVGCAAALSPSICFARFTANRCFISCC